MVFFKSFNVCPFRKESRPPFKAEERVGLPHLNFHCLRHTHASLLLQAGVDVKVVSERLGHSSVRITYDIYSHLMPGMQREAGNRLEDLLNNGR